MLPRNRPEKPISTSRARLIRIITAWSKVALVVVLILVPLVDAFARAGGAGASSGHSSGGGSFGRSSGGSGSGGGDLGFLIYMVVDIFSFLFRTIGPIPTLLIIAGIIALIVIARSKSKHDKGNAYKNLGKVWNDNASERSAKPQGWAAFSKRNPGFDEDGFLRKARAAFFGIQDAWSKQDLGPVRRFISDGVYQRFYTQFAMMKLLKQRNLLSNIDLHNIRIDRAESDGAYDILHVSVQASLYDEFICATNPSLNQSGHDDFTEFWSFLRKQKKPSGPATVQNNGQFSGSGESAGSYDSEPYKDLYQNDACPSCGAPLPKDLGERGQCPYCNTFVNSGEYDWVLSEITQADDYAADRALVQSGAISGKVPAIQKEDPNFAIQLAEDKASNAFLQILAARTQRDAKIMRRFVSDRAYERILASFDKERQIVFNRLYLNKVTLSAIAQDEQKNRLDFNIVMSAQRAEIRKDRANTVDPALRQERWVLLMSRARNAQGAKGSLYMHQCPNCGGQIQDSLDIACTYCGQAYNAGAQEWVVDDIVPASEYRGARVETAAQQPGARVKAQVSQETFERLYDVRDYAFNNLMVMIAADGIFADEERVMAENAARKLGYSKVPDLEALFQMAAKGRMSLKMPLDTSRHDKIIKLMESVAMADGDMSQEERRIVDYLRANFGGGQFADD